MRGPRSSTTQRRNPAITRLCLPFALIAALLPACATAASQNTPVAPLLPTGIAYDSAGNLYFADTNRHQVFESSLAGALTVIAGSGAQGFAGDGSAATSAQLNSPQGVAVGVDGTLYIADTGNQRIRAVTGGQITTFAGNGLAGFSGDGSAAATASFSGPGAVALDATGALLVCDTANHRIRRISAGVVTTIIGSGTQGFAGDGGPATAAQLDTPMGVAVASDGRIFVADSHNDRIRVVAADGTISTFAGTGVRGYAGDGGAAASAALSLPRGLIVTPAGALLFADSNNHRIRMVNAQGVITTIAGSGVQGATSDGATASTSGLDTPRGVAVSAFNAPVFADALNHLVRESVANGNLYVPAGLDAARTSAVSLSVAPNPLYNQTSATVSVTGSAGTPQGTVALLDGSSTLAQATLSAGAATFAPGALSVGSHSLSALFLGDGVNPAASSEVTVVNIAAGLVTATANQASIEYGQSVPVLSGTLTGILPQDQGEVSAIFTTTAAPLSPPGTYPITATLTGPAAADYSLAMSPASGSLLIAPAASLTTEQAIAQASYAGLPLLLSAGVRSTTQGTPSGTVSFTDAGTVVVTATLNGGVASATYLSPAAGTHSIVAVYGGNADFTASSSQAVTTIVGAMPDFTLSSNAATQTVAAGNVATFTMVVSAQPGPFTGVVDLSVSGLPAGATAAFSPPQVVPGSAAASVTMSVQTTAPTAQSHQFRHRLGVLFAALFLPIAFLSRRRLARAALAICSLTLFLAGPVGCGARSISAVDLSSQTYVLTVTGTSTNLAGAIVTHSTKVTLVLQ